ncbi:PTS system cellobiose-specific IIA component [Lactobacillus colini]|uniref:PTS system cellobiose-specific IIA component n=1 Tax=Lactobacillus colini TaxID=1819254 RepID=A0ABS4MGX2_9LACO|nr:PTS lactose/cellobiose transporter subunit IIA [Lactobacillus colini]MBP2058958.1 PTS system cellobiose-specific IIA component [Lactobacillus colini]
MEITKKDIESTSMQIILHAGNAKNIALKAFDLANKGNFQEADKQMQTAHKEILNAHNAQTHIIQTEAEGKEVKYSALFSHAQDTLMTVSTYIDVTKQMLIILKKFN